MLLNGTVYFEKLYKCKKIILVNKVSLKILVNDNQQIGQFNTPDFFFLLTLVIIQC